MYNDIHSNLPAAIIVNEENQLLHSWRAKISWEADGKHTVSDPMFYDKPWNSTANRQLYEGYYHPDWIYCPSDPNVSCSYYVVNVPGGIFEGQKIGSLDRIPDGTANTLLTVENVGLENHWLQPGDLGPPALAATINSSYDGTILSSHHGGGAHVVFADCRTLFLPNNTDLPTLRAIVIANDGLTLSAAQ
jgi:hypothetical protein